MSKSAVRHHLRLARRTRCSQHLSTYIVDHPKVVLPEVALRFLRFGHRPADLPKFIAADAAAKAGYIVPEHIKVQGRAIYRQVAAVRKWKATIAARMAEAKRQRKARRISRRATA